MVSWEGELDFLPQQRFSSHKGSVEALFGPRGIEISAFQTPNFGLCALMEIDWPACTWGKAALKTEYTFFSVTKI